MSHSISVTPVHCPIPHLYDFEPCAPDEIAPLALHLRENAPLEAPLVFPRGTLLEDGRLDLCKQNLGAAGCRTIVEALAQNTQVRSLLLGTDGIGDVGAADVAGLIARNPHLETIYLGCNRISAMGIERLCEVLADNRTVTGLWLKRNPIGPEGALHLARMLARNQTLRTLDLVNTDLGPDGMSAVLKVLCEENRTVERLYLGGNDIVGVQGAEPLAVLLRSNSVLKALLLNVNHLGDAGVTTLAGALRENQTLQQLGLASCGISAAGVTRLCTGLQGHPTLVALDLGYSPSTRVLGASGNAFGDTGAYAVADYLSQDPRLRRLDLRKTGIGLRGKQQLTEALERNHYLVELLLDGREDATIKHCLERNRATSGAAAFPPPEVAMIRSVYRTTTWRT